MGQFAKTLTSYVAFTRPFSLWSRVKLVGARVLVRIGVRPVERPLWVKPRSFGAAVAVRPYYVDLVAAEEIFEERVYETVLEFLPARLTIVDLGAQAGLAAQYLARGREVTELVAAEPDADLNHTLHANLAAICPRARIHLAAVWDHESSVVNEGDAVFH